MQSAKIQMCFGVIKRFAFARPLALLMFMACASAGAADTVSTVLRQTIRQLATPNHLRGRMTSINMVFFMGGPQQGELEAGVVAAIVGAPLSVVIGGAGSLASALAARFKAKALMRYESADSA